jgi:predicted house-cleaning noncanonical NTP pyrophosphatase (MazG superfamily)/HKD family nuclease
MARTIYNKLVRDCIPDIIRSEGKNPLTSVVPEADRLRHLSLKLLEEAHEVFRCGDESEFVKEAADLIEVLRALASAHGVNWERVEAERVARARELGGFSQGVFLQSVQDGRGRNRSEPSLPVTPCLLTRDGSPSLLDVLRRELGNSRHCRIATAFYTRGMLNQLMRPFDGFLEQGGQLQILTSVMNNFNNPDDLVHLRRELPQCEIHIYYPGHGDGEERFASLPRPFHLKSFLFEKLDGQHSLIVGSSNLTTGGLEGNEEWNLYSNSEVNLSFSINDARSIYETARIEFDRHWAQESVEVTNTFLDSYRPRWERTRTARRILWDQIATRSVEEIRPRPAQKEAIQELDIRRRLGVRKAAIIAATGLGKTHLAAFDFKQSGMRSLLFIVHRENILREAREVFRQVLGDPKLGVILSGKRKAAERKAALRPGTSVFAMIQTLSRPDVLHQFNPHQFDYVVVDEFHHSKAASYQTVLDHFNPRFFLGLTATPERMDGRDILEFCDFNVAYEARLFDAIDQGWLAPFQYFAIQSIFHCMCFGLSVRSTFSTTILYERTALSSFSTCCSKFSPGVPSRFRS